MWPMTRVYEVAELKLGKTWLSMCTTDRKFRHSGGVMRHSSAPENRSV